MNYVKTYDEATNEWHTVLNTMLITLKKKQTRHNRRILNAFFYEFKYDKDYNPESAESLIKFFENRDIKKCLD